MLAFEVAGRVLKMLIDSLKPLKLQILDTVSSEQQAVWFLLWFSLFIFLFVACLF